MTTFPTPHTIGHRAYLEGSKDARGNPVKSWADPVDVAVIGWYQPSSVEPNESARDAVRSDLVVLAPPTFLPGPHDRLVINDDEYEVDGHPQDLNHGPFGFRPGNVINANRVEG